MADVKIDRIETLAMRERWGAIVGVRRQAVVTGLSSTSWAVMYDALDVAGLPSYGDYLDEDRGSHLALTDRNVRMIDKDTAEVELVYGDFNDQGQQLDHDYGGMGDRIVSGKMQTSIVQKRTNLYREGGQGEEQLITVEHTYPASDPDYGGQTITQSGEVDVHLAQNTFTITGVKDTDAPWNLAGSLTGAINYLPWLGYGAHTWMCTEVTWKQQRTGKYFMTFTFQRDPDSWNPTAMFVDDRTGRPPEGLVAGTGYRYIRYHKEYDFTLALGFFVVGPG